MKNYFFTFGQSHVNLDGEQMKDYYVKVSASSYGKAREMFIEQFTKHKMEKSDKWAFQYDETDFEPKYFPKGEYLHLTEYLQKVYDEMTTEERCEIEIKLVNAEYQLEAK